MLGFLLYGVLGVALNAVGVNAVDKPWQFIVIMLIVVGIDINSKFGS